jgi:hypothetical protein
MDLLAVQALQEEKVQLLHRTEGNDVFSGGCAKADEF